MDDSYPRFKIADFGISCAVTEHRGHVTSQSRGTEEYIAPEVRRNIFHTPADIWALGCMMLFFTVGQEEMSKWTIFVRDEICDEKSTSEVDQLIEYLPEFPEYYECFKIFTKKTLTLSPDHRPNATAVREMLDQTILTQSVGSTIKDYRDTFPQSLAIKRDTAQRASDLDSTIIRQFHRACVERDFENQLGLYFRHSKGIEIVLEPSAEINEVERGWTALGYASWHGHVDVVEVLLDAGADVDKIESEGYSPLHDACVCGEAKIVKLLLAKSAKVNVRNDGGQTPLHLAIGKKNEEIVNLLLEAKAEMNIGDISGSTALHAAGSAGSYEIMQLLLNYLKSRQVKTSERLVWINICDQYGQTPLHRVVSQGSAKTFQLLLDAGSDVTVRYQNGRTVLHEAASTGHESIVKILLDLNVDVSTRDGSGDTPLHIAVEDRRLEIVNMLLEKDKSRIISAKNNAGWTPLHLAIKGGSEEMVRRLLKAGSDIKQSVGDFSDGLQLASRFNATEVIPVLLEMGANVNAKGGWYGNALQVAARHGNTEVVNILLKHEADVNAEGGWFGSALKAASSYSHDDIVQLLHDKGATLEAQCSGQDAGLNTEIENLAHEYWLPGYLKQTRYGLSVSQWSCKSVPDGNPDYTTPPKLPSVLNAHDSSPLLTVNEDGLEIRLCTNENNDAGSIRANHPLPPSTQVYYFEVEIIDQGVQGYVSIFLSALTAVTLGLALVGHRSHRTAYQGGMRHHGVTMVMG